MGNDGHPLNLHFVMFLPTLMGQMDEEQQQQWVQPALTRQFIGTYAQTELGHGNFPQKGDLLRLFIN
jgi:acyl-CoA oxidase